MTRRDAIAPSSCSAGSADTRADAEAIRSKLTEATTRGLTLNERKFAAEALDRLLAELDDMERQRDEAREISNELLIGKERPPEAVFDEFRALHGLPTYAEVEARAAQSEADHLEAAQDAEAQRRRAAAAEARAKAAERQRDEALLERQERTAALVRSLYEQADGYVAEGFAHAAAMCEQEERRADAAEARVRRLGEKLADTETEKIERGTEMLRIHGLLKAAEARADTLQTALREIATLRLSEDPNESDTFALDKARREMQAIARAALAGSGQL